MNRKMLLSIFFVLLFTPVVFGAEKALVVDVRSNGLPGFAEGKPVSQRIVVHGDKLRMENPKQLLVTIIRLDRKEIYQIDGNRSIYRVQPFEELAKYRKEYLKQRADVLKQVERYKPGRRRIAAERWGFRIDLLDNVHDDIEPEFVDTGEKAKKNGFNCRRLLFKEHGKVVFDVWVTDEVKYPANMFRFYADLGIFDPGLVEKMKNVKDFPIVLKVALGHASSMYKRKIETEVLKVKTGEVAEDLFEIPEGLTKWEKREPPKEVPCPICGKMVNIEEARKAGMKRSYHWKLFICYFDSEEHKEAFKEKIKAAYVPEEDEDDEEEAAPEKPKPPGPEPSK